MTKCQLSCTIIFLFLALVQGGCGPQRQNEMPAGFLQDETDTCPRGGSIAPSGDEIRALLAERRRTDSALAKKVSFCFRGSPLSKAMAELSAASGVGIIVILDSSIHPPLADQPVYLSMNSVELSAALDWIMRQVNARYAFDGSTVTVAADPRNLFTDELVQKVYPLGTMRLFDKPVPELADIDFEKETTFRCVKTCLAEYLANRPDARLVLTKSHNEFLAVCSTAAHERIMEVLNEIARNKEATPPLPRPDTRKQQLKLQQMVRCSYSGRPLMEALEKLGLLSGVAIGVDPADLADGFAEQTDLDLGEVPLKVALDAIVQRHKLYGYSFEEGRGIWLQGASDHPTEGRILWQSGLIRSYCVEQEVSRRGLVQFLDLVKLHVTPGQWQGGLPAMCCSSTGRLIVFHYREAHVQLEALLDNLGSQPNP